VSFGLTRAFVAKGKNIYISHTQEQEGASRLFFLLALVGFWLVGGGGCGRAGMHGSDLLLSLSVMMMRESSK